MAERRSRRNKDRSKMVARKSDSREAKDDRIEYRSKKRSNHSTIDPSSRIDNSIITTKRLTVGVRGIFGNARTSSSVYREIQHRLENRKLSRDVTCEIEHNLSRIIPKQKNRCKKNVQTDSAPRDGLSDFQTPVNTSTPISCGRHNNGINHGSMDSCKSRSVSSVQSTLSDNENMMPCTTPSFPRKLTQIAEKMVASVPQFKIFKDCNFLENLKADLKRIHEESHTLTVVPKFEKEDFSQYSQETPVMKKPCVEYQEQAENLPENNSIGIENMMTESIEDGENVETCSSNITKPGRISLEEQLKLQSAIPFDEKPAFPMGSFPVAHTTEPSHNTVPQFIFNPTNNESKTSLKRRPDDQLPYDLIKSPNVSSEFVDHSNVLQILRQPISTLRCSRQRREVAMEERHVDELQHSDLLDYIDSIPIHTLEQRLLSTNNDVVPSSQNSLPTNQFSCRQSSFKQQQQQQTLSPSTTDDDNPFQHHSKHHLPIELTKPLLESPSPPKLYRMNMF